MIVIYSEKIKKLDSTPNEFQRYKILNHSAHGLKKDFYIMMMLIN